MLSTDVERYKDKYTSAIKKIEDGVWTPGTLQIGLLVHLLIEDNLWRCFVDWNCLPKELKPQRKIIKKKTGKLKKIHRGG